MASDKHNQANKNDFSAISPDSNEGASNLQELQKASSSSEAQPDYISSPYDSQLRAKGEALLEVKDLVKHFQTEVSGEIVRAVDGVSFEIRKGETLGLVGESGCGKSTVGRTIIRLYEPTAGKIFFEGIDLTALNQKQLRTYRSEIQMIFQDPYASLDPRKSVLSIVSEPLLIHKVNGRSERKQRVEYLLEKVGLDPSYANRYPHEFSGGQRQRIGIARALALNPKLIICDEPVSALDVSVQAQVLNLLKDLKDEFGLTYLFISHGLSVVEYLSDRIAVMYLGKIVEIGPSGKVFKDPLHPYTAALVSAAPQPDIRARRKRIILEGDVPSPINPPKGCRFHTRCPIAQEVCKSSEPQLVEFEPGWKSACFFPKKINEAIMEETVRI
ncbi:MAG TPA: ABC transporter ATP-binding protein [Pyrinomonadaceae bacterium]|nr:ABC transporter ATP-binding protein [Pyrinomonadaceae bacterium]